MKVELLENEKIAQNRKKLKDSALKNHQKLAFFPTEGRLFPKNGQNNAKN
ncbi:MAG: hypothetical protein IKG83_03540 [Prevotella sp.]|nr:hypothetical protein [Prevotella sp.]